MHAKRIDTITHTCITPGWAVACASVLMVTGCAVGPDYQRPDAPPVERYTVDALPVATASTDTPGGAAQHFLNGRDLPEQWWESFKNDELNRRVQEALNHSPTIAAAQAAQRQAVENALAAGAALFPRLDASAGISRQKQSGATFGGAFNFQPLTVYNTSVAVSYGIDLFGGTRRGIEAQQALAQFQQAQTQATYLVLVANVVTASMQEASLREQLQATEAIVAAQESELDIVQKQQAIGARSLSDTLAVRVQVASTRAALPPLRARLAAIRNQLATYLGVAPAQLNLQALHFDAVTLPQDIPVSLPSTLLAKRPDIRAASAQLHAVTAQVGVATAAMLPQISLTGNAGSSALSAGELFSAGGESWALGLGLTQPLFHGGELKHRKKAAEAAMDKSLADWQQTVLSAFQNVADALQALQFDAQGLAAQQIAAESAAQQLALVRKQYRIGATDYVNLLNAERAHQQARIAFIQARAARLTDTVALYAALGGGWNDDANDSSPIAATAK